MIFNKWCAILCSYRTNEYEDFKGLCYKMEMSDNQISLDKI